MAALCTLKNSVLYMIILILLVSNVLLITSSGFHSLAVSFLESLPFDHLIVDAPSTMLKRLEAENKALKEKNRKLTTSNKLAAKKMKQLHAVNQKLISEREIRTKKIALARQISKRIAQRTVRNVTAELGSMVGKSHLILVLG